MIRVDRATIHGFRGIKHLTIDLKGQNFAIGGPNGTGKSGVVDALEFALTGSISRLSGAGSYGLTVQKHGPHVDSRDKPADAWVSLEVSIPSLNKTATIRRSVKEARTPRIVPAEPDILSAFDEVAHNPEFVLSRREIIKYVLAEPGRRSEQVQALLRLDEIDALRGTLLKISNAAAKEVLPLVRAKETAATQLLVALQVAELKGQVILAAANERRAALGLPALASLESTTSIKDGLATLAQAGPVSRIPKAQALSDLSSFKTAIAGLAAPEFLISRASAEAAASDLARDATLLEGVSRAQLLNLALRHFDDAHCPVCETEWEPDKLRSVIAEKLVHLEEVGKRRDALEVMTKPLAARIEKARAAADVLVRYGALAAPPVDLESLRAHSATLRDHARRIESLLPIADCQASLEAMRTLPDLAGAVADLERAIVATPEPTQQDAAREFLLIGQERLDAYRTAALEHKRAEVRAAKAAKVFEVFGRSTTDALEGIYKKVEGAFSQLYREVNREDESTFTAQLTPSTGKLGLEVDFYGRGHFPPGAYHSEGHQDGMGLCLYLALMGYLLGRKFTFAVLDDVLMSVDAGHRREVCNLLKNRFPDTQFILTTHDEIWLRHMKTVGLLQSRSSMQFRKWTVDGGPVAVNDQDIWVEIDDRLANNEVSAASAALRQFLEYLSAELCHALRANVEFRGDAQFSLGELLPNALSAFGDALKKGKAAANAWNQKDRVDAISAIEAGFADARARSQVDQWQVNASVHYNEWAQLHSKDFRPVAAAFKELVSTLQCAKCGGLYSVRPSYGRKETLRCDCDALHINLVDNRAS